MLKLMKFRRRKSTVTQNNPANPKGDCQSGTTTKDKATATTASLGSRHTDVVVISGPVSSSNGNDHRKKEKERRRRQEKQRSEKEGTSVQADKTPTNSDVDTETDTESDTEPESDRHASQLDLLSRSVSSLEEVCKKMASSVTALQDEGYGAVFSLPSSISRKMSYYNHGGLSEDDDDGIEVVPDMDFVKLSIKLNEKHWEIWDAKDKSFYALPAELHVECSLFEVFELLCRPELFTFSLSCRSVSRSPKDGGAAYSVYYLGHTLDLAKPMLMRYERGIHTDAWWQPKSYRECGKWGWFLKFWIPMPMVLFRNAETRMFGVEARLKVSEGTETIRVCEEMSVSHLRRGSFGL